MRPLILFSALGSLASCEGEVPQPTRADPTEQGVETSVPAEIVSTPLPLPLSSPTPEKTQDQKDQEAAERAIQGNIGNFRYMLDAFDADKIGIEQKIRVDTQTGTIIRTQDTDSDNEQLWPKDHLRINTSVKETPLTVELDSGYNDGTGRDKTENISLTEWATVGGKNRLVGNYNINRRVDGNIDGIACSETSPCVYGFQIEMMSPGEMEMVARAAKLFEEMNQ